MLGASRSSLAQLIEHTEAIDAVADTTVVSQELFEVADLLNDQRPLRQALSDPGRTEADRSEVVQTLLGDKLSAPTLDVVQAAVRRRWSRDRDLVDALEQMAVLTRFIGAERTGELDQVEAELFRLERLIVDSAELQLTLNDTGLPADVKQNIVTDLLQGRTNPTTVAIASAVTARLHGRRIERQLAELLELAARRRDRVVAQVTSAKELTQEQQDRLRAAIGRIYGAEIQLQLLIDPRVVGGLSVQVGDEVIDGTIAHRIQQARTRLAGKSAG